MAGIGGVTGPGARLAADALGRQDTGGIRLKVGEGSSTSFSDTLKAALGQVSSLQSQAQDAIGAFVRGEPVEIHDVMAAADEAGIALDMLIQVRNKLADAYRSVMQMQS